MANGEFGPAVRRWRSRLTPESVGVPVGARRRATGLRREELAALAAISVDYLTRLEQGRAMSPSAQVVEALARSLRLSDNEREIIFHLAGMTVPGPDVVSARITPSIQRLLDRLASNPVVIYDATWTVIEANAAYDALMGDTTTWRGIERNAVWRNLAGAENRTVHTTDEQANLQAQLVGDLRLTAARYPADRRLRQLVMTLRAQSTRFVELWDSPPNLKRQDPGRHKIIDHPAVGHIALECDTLVVADNDVRMMVYTAEPGTEDAERLGLAIVIGTQTLERTSAKSFSGLDGLRTP